MPSGQSFLFDLKLPNNPPTDNVALYTQLDYIYKAIFILAENLQSVNAELLSTLLIAGSNVTLTVDLTVPSITISVPAEGIQDVVGAMTSSANTGIGIVYNDTAGTLVFTLSTEYIQDIIGTFLSSSTTSPGVNFTYNDAGNTLVAALNLSDSGSVVPATATSTGVKGTMVYDSSYLYICVATDTWRRIAHVTW